MSRVPSIPNERPRPLALPFLMACAMGMALAWSGRPVAALFLAMAGLAYLIFGLMSIRDPLVWAAGILLVLEVAPPLYFDRLGDTPVYASFLLLPIGLAVVVTRFPDMRFEWDPVAKGLTAFLAGTAASMPFAFWLSGTEAGMSSLSRWVLLGHAALVYFLIRAGARRDPSRTEGRMFGLLLAGAVLSAAYGVVDFLWPIPLAHPSADQFIWLEGAVIRRAQGPFYESSNFANFCGFFLVAASAALFGPRERCLGIPRSLLPLVICVLGLAVLVAFSRSTWASVLTALAVFALMSRFARPLAGIAVLIALLVPLGLLWAVSPELWEYLVDARLGRLFDILADPDSATSGRFETWKHVLSIMRDEPQYLFFGIGYKTLTVTRLFQGPIVTDNGYLSLLLETGLVGLSGFLVLSGAILRVFFRLARSADERLAFWSAVLFSIWCGELVQLLAADAYTYWRNISVLAALMALTLNLAERAGFSEASS